MTPANAPGEIRKARVYERNRGAFVECLARASGGWLLQEGAVKVCGLPFPHPFSGLMSPAWKEADRAQNFRLALRLFQSTGRGMVVSLGPASQPDGSFRELLKSHRFHCVYHVPFFHLDAAGYRARPRHIAGVVIRSVVDPASVRDQVLPWIGPLTTPARRARFALWERELPRTRPRLWQWVAWHQGNVIGGVQLFRYRDTGGIYDMEVYPPYRRRGIGLALMQTACLHARDIGLRAVGLSASQEATGLYRKTGFTPAGLWSDYFLGSQKMRNLRV
ncbi:MAG: GNAT family N-acetyltransferase [Verrucomicrobiota bacterium]